MALVVSIAREEPLCVKASAEAAGLWAHGEKGYGFSDRGTIEYSGGRRLEITLNVAVRPNANSAEYTKFPNNLESSGHLTDDAAPVGAFTVKRGKATVAIMVPALQSELETNLDESIELDRVVLATGTDAHLRMIVSIRLCSAAVETKKGEAAQKAPQMAQAEIGVAVHGTSHSAGSTEGGGRAAQAFTEETTAAIVFAHGAVVRLAEVVVPGQILILRHLASGEEAACRVVRVKANTTVKGFVELEFLQPAPGFWGAALSGENGGKSGGAPAIAKSTPSAAPRHVFSKLLDVPAAISEVLHREHRPKAAEARAPAASNVPAVAESVSAAAKIEPAAAEPAPIAAEIAPIVAQPAPVVSEAAPIRAEATSVEPEPTHTATPPVGARPMEIAAETAMAATEEVTTEAAVADSALGLPALDAPAPFAANATPISVEHAPVAAEPKPVAAGAKVTPIASVNPKTDAPPPLGAVLPGGEALSRDAVFAWNRGSGPKKSRAGTVGLAAAMVLAGVAVGGFYRWQREAKQNASAAAVIEAVPSAAAPVGGADPSPKPSANAALSAAPAAASGAPGGAASAGSFTAPSATSHGNATNTGAAEAGAGTESPAAKHPNVAGAARALQAPRGRAVAGMTMEAPTAATRSADTTTPAISAAMPSLAASASAGGILADTPSSGPAAPPSARTSSGVRQPRLLSAPEPIYPDQARAARVQGDVSVDLLISDTGKVAGLSVLSGSPLLRDAALNALRQRRYAPAMLDGKPVSAHVVVVLHFQL
jgi:TonB family protein